MRCRTQRDADAHRSLMQYYLRAPAIAGGSRDKALAQAKRIAEIDRLAAYRAMASFWTAQEDIDKAAAEYAAAVDAFPEDNDLRFEHGLFLQQAEEWEGAYAAFMTILDREPDDGEPDLAWAHTRLGQVYVHMGRSDDARAHFEAALSLDPEHEEAKKALAAPD